jgi:hypothetical protein
MSISRVLRPDVGIESPGQRFLRVFQPVESELEEQETTTTDSTSSDTTSEAQAPTNTEVEVETEELYEAEDPRNIHHDENEPPASQS